MAEHNKFQERPFFSSCHPPALLFPLAVAAGSVFTELTLLLRLVLVASRRVDVVTVVMIISKGGSGNGFIAGISRVCCSNDGVGV